MRKVDKFEESRKKCCSEAWLHSNNACGFCSNNNLYEKVQRKRLKVSVLSLHFNILNRNKLTEFMN